MNYSFLDPVQVGKCTLKNRIIYPAQCRLICTEDGFVTDRFVEYYRNIARGGCSLIVPELGIVDDSWKLMGPMPALRLSDEKYIPGLKRAVEAVHAEDCLICFQLWHPGIAPPACPSPTLNDLSVDQIHEIQEKYIRAARICKASGADGIEFHLAHNYLPQEFFTPYFNRRTDEYGAQNSENALRFSKEILDGIRDACCSDGSDFLILLKVNATDFMETGTTPERTAQACHILESSGVSMITVSAGGSLTSYAGSFDTGRNPEGYKVPLAKIVKNAVSVPVAAIDGLRTPAFIDAVIREGQCDLAAIGRGMVAEPHWVKKVTEGREDEIRPCLHCLYCFNGNPETLSGCSVNPFSKREFLQPPLEKNGDGRVVAIVGAGPAGLEAAVTLAERGFSPVVIDQAETIGGLLLTARIPPYKQRLDELIRYYEAQIRRLSIEVRTGITADKAYLESLSPYAVIVASGSKEKAPPIPGIEHAVPVRELLQSQPPLSGGTVVVLGGGSSGVEAAQLYLQKGNTVHVLEMLPRDPMPHIGDNIILEEAIHDGVTIHWNTRAEKIEPGRVLAFDTAAGTHTEYAADLIVSSLGAVPERALFDELKEALPRVYAIGDAVTPGRIVHAVQAGADLGYALE